MRDGGRAVWPRAASCRSRDRSARRARSARRTWDRSRRARRPRVRPSRHPAGLPSARSTAPRAARSPRRARPSRSARDLRAPRAARRSPRRTACRRDDRSRPRGSRAGRGPSRARAELAVRWRLGGVARRAGSGEQWPGDVEGRRQHDEQSDDGGDHARPRLTSVDPGRRARARGARASRGWSSVPCSTPSAVPTWSRGASAPAPRRSAARPARSRRTAPSRRRC